MKSANFLMVIAVALSVSMAGFVQAQEESQTSLIDSGDWFNGNNWDPNVPSGNDEAIIGDDLTATVGGPGAEAKNIVLGNSGGDGTLTIGDGGVLLLPGDDDDTDSNWVGNAPGVVGTLNIHGGTFDQPDNVEIFIGHNADTTGVVNVTAGAFHTDRDVIVGTAGAGALNVSGGAYFSGRDLLINHPVGDVDATGSGEVTVTGGFEDHNHRNLRVGTGTGSGTFRVSGSGQSIGVFRGEFDFGANATIAFELDDGGAPSLRGGNNDDLTMGGTLEIGLAVAGLTELIDSIVLIETRGAGEIMGTFDDVVWNDGVMGNVVYTADEVRVENVEMVGNVLVQSGDWFVGDNWLPDVPTSAEAAIIGNGLTATVDGPGAEAKNIMLGNSGGDGTLTIGDGGVLSLPGADDDTDNNWIGNAPGVVGTLNINGGTFAQPENIELLVGHNPDTTGVVNITEGTFHTDRDVFVGSAGTGTLNVSGGSYSSGRDLLINHGATANEHPTGTGEVIVSGGFEDHNHRNLRVGTGAGSGTFRVSGSDQLIDDFRGEFEFGANATVAFELDDGGAPRLVGGNNDDLTMGGTLEISLATSGATEFGPVVLIQSRGNGEVVGTFDNVVWKDALVGDVVYTGTQVRLENLETGNLLIDSGDWFDPNNWDPDVPTSTDPAIIGNSLTATIDGPGAEARQLMIGSGGDGTLTLGENGVLSLSGDADSHWIGFEPEFVGTLNIDGGTFDQPESVELFIGHTVGTTGVVNITTGTFHTDRDVVVGTAGTGTLNVSGGSYSSGRDLLINHSTAGVDATGTGEVTISGGFEAHNHRDLRVGTGTGSGTLLVSGSDQIIGDFGGEFEFGANASIVFELDDGGAPTFVGGNNNDLMIGGTLEIGLAVAELAAGIESVVLIQAEGSGQIVGTFDDEVWRNGLVGDVVYTDTQVRLENVGTATLLSASGDWFDQNNWDPNIPTSTDPAIIGDGLTVTIDDLGAEARNIMLGSSGGNGTLTIGEGGELFLSGTDVASWIGDAPGTAGTLNIDGGTFEQPEGADLFIGHASGRTGVVNLTAGTLNAGRDVVVGTAGTGTLNVSGGSYSSGRDLLINHSTAGVDATGTGEVTISGGFEAHNHRDLRVGTGTGSGTLLVSGSDQIIGDFGGEFEFGANATIVFELDDGGAPTFVGGNNNDLMLGGTLEIGLVVPELPEGIESIVLFQAEGDGQIVGTFDDEIWTNGLVGEVVYTDTEVRLENVRTGTLLVASGDWFDENNWNPNVPMSTDPAIIGDELTATIEAPGAEARNIMLGNAGGDGTLVIGEGGMLSLFGDDADNWIGNAAGVVGTLTINGGTFDQPENVELFIGHRAGRAGVVNVTAGTFHTDRDVVVGTAGTGTLNVTGGSYSSGRDLLINHPVGDVDATGSGEVTVSGGFEVHNHRNLRVGTGTGSGTFRVSGSDQSIDDFRGEFEFGANAMIAFELDSAGAPTLVGGNNDDLTMGGTLDISLFAAETLEPLEPVVIIRTRGTGQIVGTFDEVVLNDDLMGDVVYTDTEVRLENVRSGNQLVNSGDWFDATNWNPDMPSSDISAIIGDNLTVTLNEPGAEAMNLLLGSSGGDGTLTIGAGGVLSLSGGDDNWIGNVPGVVGTLNIDGGTFDQPENVEFFIGHFSGTIGVVNMTAGTFHTDRDVVVGTAGTGTLNVSGGAYSSGRDLLINHPTAGVDEEDATGTGEVVVTGGFDDHNHRHLRVGTGTGSGTLRISGSDQFIDDFRGEFEFGANATVAFELDDGGAPTLVGGNNDFLRMGGTLEISLVGPALTEPIESIVLIETTGAGEIIGTFDEEVWKDGVAGEVVYTDTEVRLENVRFENEMPITAEFGTVRFVGLLDQATEGTWSGPSAVNEGDEVYIGTTETITSLPAELSGNLAFRTESGAAERLGFIVDRDVTVFIAVAEGVTVPPWIADRYNQTDMTIATTAGDFAIWERDFSAREYVILQESADHWVVLSEGPEAISSPEFFERSAINPDDWRLDAHHWTLTTDAEAEPHVSSMLTRLANFDPARGFQMSTAIRVPRLQDAGDNAFGFLLGEEGVAGIRAEWLPRTGDSASSLRLVSASSGQVLVEMPWDGLTPTGIDNDVGVGTGATESLFSEGDTFFTDADPEIVFAEDFEDGAVGWTSGSEPGTVDQWEIGEPDPNFGPADGAFSGDNVAATNLGDYYESGGTGSVSWLRSPVIDLSDFDGGMSLSFREFMELDQAVHPDDGTPFHFGRISVLDADTLDELEVLASYNEEISEWTERKLDLSSFTGQQVVLEFALVTDDVSFDGAGWYLDAIEVGEEGAQFREKLAHDGSLYGIATERAGIVDESDSHLEFTASDRAEAGNDGVTVFVAWDVRASGLEPDWLRDDFTLTDHFVGVSGPAEEHRLWAREYADGETVTLGGASAAGSGPFPEDTNNYFVLFGDARSGLDELYTLTIEGVIEEGEWSLDFTLSDANGHGQTVSATTEEMLDGSQVALFARHPDAAAGTVTHSPIWEILEFSIDFMEGLPGFQAWREQHFDEEQLDDPEISGATATPAGDGIENLLKYALGLNPFIGATATDIHQLDPDDENILVLRYSERTDINDIEYIPEVSEDLSNWESGEPHVEKVFGTINEEDNTREVEAIGNLPEEVERGFMRLKVRQTE